MTSTKQRTAPLPASYVRARRKLGGQEIDLDWRKLARRVPPQWPGMIFLYRVGTLREGAYVIGTNTAGLLFALDDRDRVVVLDEAELGEATVLARDFDTFTRAFVSGSERTAHRAKERARAARGMAARWKKLDDIVASTAGTHLIARNMDVRALLVDIANDYLVDGRRDEFLEALAAFRKRHPVRGKRLATELRAYAARWGTSR
jgi:hypothetical protein